MTDPIHYLDVPVQQADVPSVTGKIYPYEQLKKLEGHPARFGELNPSRRGRDVISLGSIHLDNASHEVSNFRMVDGVLLADFKVAHKLPMGQVLENVFDLCRPALRAFVRMNENNVVTHMDLVTVDLVADTSLFPKPPSLPKETQ